MPIATINTASVPAISGIFEGLVGATGSMGAFAGGSYTGTVACTGSVLVALEEATYLDTALVSSWTSEFHRACVISTLLRYARSFRLSGNWSGLGIFASCTSTG